MHCKTDFLVIGGGIAGLLTARELAAEGYATTLIERQKVGREASRAGGGILFPLYPWRQPDAILRLCQHSGSLYAGLARDLKETTGIDPEWDRCGMLIPGACSHEALSGCRAHGIAAREISPGETAALIPRLSVGNGPALWLPEIAQIRNPRLLAALHMDLNQKGVRVLEDTAACRFSIVHDRITEVIGERQTFSAGEVVIAAGAWSAQLAKGLPPQPDIQPVKGQMLLYKSRPGLVKPIVLDQDQDRYLIPRKDGHILVGSTVESSGFDKSTSLEVREQLDAFARRLLPELSADSLIDHWAGLRPGSPAGIPYIGRHPIISNLSFNCGHFRNGFGMAPASARLLADLLTRRAPCVPPEPYAITAKR
ncbi:MAG: glycine oxidase ThiO [Gammaproteobacteria bacterium]